MSHSFPFSLTTDRLYLKVLDKEDAPIVLDFFLRNKGYFEKYEPILGDDFYTLAYQEDVLEFEYSNILKGSLIRYWIFKKNDPSVIIGTISYRNISRPIYSCCTVGYKMDPRFQSKGYCTEALDFTVKHVITKNNIHRVEALVMPSNIPSITMLETVGFEREGLLKDKIILNNTYLDHYLYAYLGDN